MLSEDENAYVLALVHIHLKSQRQYVSWIPAYVTYRCAIIDHVPHMIPIHVGGHFRMKAFTRKSIAALKCTCKFEDLSYDTGVLL